MKSTVVDESLSSFKPMYCSREYQASTRLIQQYEKSTLKVIVVFVLSYKLIWFVGVSIIPIYNILTVSSNVENET